MFIIVQDNWLQKQECEYLIHYYEINYLKARKYKSYFPLVLQSNEIPFLQKKFNETVSKINGSEYSYCGIVKWKPNTELYTHRDFEYTEKNVNNGHVMASVVYLNDDYKGGQTFIDDGTVIEPAQGRAIFFDGIWYRHGVRTVKNNFRYTLAAWFKAKKDE